MRLRRRRTAPSAQPGIRMDVQVRSQRDRMAASWAAELLGLIGHAAHDYTHDLTHRHDRQDDSVLVRQLAADLDGKVSHAAIHRRLAHLLREARRQVLGWRKGP